MIGLFRGGDIKYATEDIGTRESTETQIEATVEKIITEYNLRLDITQDKCNKVCDTLKTNLPQSWNV